MISCNQAVHSTSVDDLHHFCPPTSIQSNTLSPGGEAKIPILIVKNENMGGRELSIIDVEPIKPRRASTKRPEKRQNTEFKELGLHFGLMEIDEDLRKPFKKARRTPFTLRIIEFAGLEYKMPNNIKLYDGTSYPEDHLSRFAGAANSGEWPMPVWCRMFQQTLDGSARGWFERLPHDNINEWADLRKAFAARFSSKACFKNPMKSPDYQEEKRVH
ncbi:reverse transcriptase domain-containing protein [Tanacetum coccineum]